MDDSMQMYQVKLIENNYQVLPLEDLPKDFVYSFYNKLSAYKFLVHISTEENTPIMPNNVTECVNCLWDELESRLVNNKSELGKNYMYFKSGAKIKEIRDWFEATFNINLTEILI